MPRKKKSLGTSTAHASGLGEAFAPLIRAIVREEIAELMRAAAHRFAPVEPPAVAPESPAAAPEAPRNGRDKRNKGDAAGEHTTP